jgi:DNA repair protein RadA/Sms
MTEAARSAGWPGRSREVAAGGHPAPLAEVSEDAEERHPTGIGEFDRVLGGGFVPGSLVLLGGEPGVGKSTLLLQAAAALARKGPVLYMSAEESLRQLRSRAGRLNTLAPSLYVVAGADAAAVREHARSVAAKTVIVDSIQTVYLPEVPSPPGSLAQVRECALEFMRLAKEEGITFLLIGHVTKEGSLAGPKALEHLVDTVLYLEGERYSSLRVLRAVKNRFGSTNEVGVFQMGEEGLVEVSNPSALFLAGRPGQSSGSVVVAGLEGSRSVLLELQALVCPTVFGNPRRLAAGLDLQRVLLLLAVLEKRCGLPLGGQDVYLNLAGGLKLEEPAADLAVCLAVASSYFERPLGQDLVVAGEVGLTGEVRRINQIEKRLSEAVRLGFRRFMLPRSNVYDLPPTSLEVVGVEDLEEAFRLLGLR